MEEFALALLAMTASHHRWPLKPPLEPAAIVRPAPAQTRYVNLRELRKSIDRYCREQKHFNKSARRSRAPMTHRCDSRPSRRPACAAGHGIF